MISWILYCVVVAALVASAARAADALARIIGYRVRWIWLGALALTTYLSISSAVQRVERPESLMLLVPTSQSALVAPVHQTWIQIARSFVNRADRAMTQPLTLAAHAIDRTVSASTTTYAALAWMIVSLVLATIFAAIIYRFQSARRHWPVSQVQDVAVRVSPTVGPIVIGLVRPEIIVPQWLLRRSADEQLLAVAHEQEHLRARDPLLLSIGWFLVIVAPWNAAVWYMLTRLRLAIELDCDARVLRRGAAPRAYGSLLIEVAQNASPLTLSALGLADESSQLYQRILALRGSAGAFARTRAVGAGLVAAAGLLVACSITPPPPSAPTPSAGPQTAPPAQTVVATATVRESVTSTASAPAASRTSATSASAPASTSTQPRRPDRSASAASISASDSATVPASVASLNDSPPAQPQRPQFLQHLDSVAVANNPLLLIDGVRSTMNALKSVDPKTIDHVEVIKGAAAIAEHGPDAEHGVIIVTTKKTPPQT
ncbi:MAG TPA: M56 family metallopeptidase [Gemmatimonadaceae bacterium]|jgi:beta-lactamase regulating signal transducer with metallopeptidase domain